MPVFDDLRKEITLQRNTRFPPDAISDDGANGRPVRHKIGGQDLIDYISGVLLSARLFIDQAILTGDADISRTAGEVRIDCSKLVVTELFTINSSMLQDAPDFVVTLDFSDAQLCGVFIDIDYLVLPAIEHKAFHFIFDRATSSDRIFFKALAVDAQRQQTDQVFVNRVSVEASELDARRELCFTGKIGEIRVEKSKIGNLFVRDAEIVNIDFSATTFDGGVVFQAVHVQGDVSFAGAIVKSEATLSNCTFALPPDLHDASFPSETVFLHTHYGSAKKNYRRFEFSDADINKAPGRFRALRVAMKKAGAQHEEADFFAHELRARRRAAMSRDSAFHMSWTEVLVSKIYDLGSVFGTSISRALFCFLAWNLLFGLLFYVIDFKSDPLYRNVQIVNGADQPFSGQPIVLLVLQNAFNPLALFSSNSTAKVMSWVFFILSMLQSIGSFSIGALVLLAIKVRFQRGSGGGS